MTAPLCPFCDLIAARRYDYKSVVGGVDVVDFEPLNPVVPGHRLFVPSTHVTDAAKLPHVTAGVMQRAANFVKHLGIQANIITSVGPAATQTVFHLHAHVVPRTEGDGLLLPWTNQAK